MTRNKIIGDRGEQLAAQYLIDHGCELLARNVRTPYGEIDLIVREGETIVFVEVKTRSSARCGTGFEAITPKKQATLLRCAEHYAAEHAIETAMRIDAIEIMLDTHRLTHLKGAVT